MNQDDQIFNWVDLLVDTLEKAEVPPLTGILVIERLMTCHTVALLEGQSDEVLADFISESFGRILMNIHVLRSETKH